MEEITIAVLLFAILLQGYALVRGLMTNKKLDDIRKRYNHRSIEHGKDNE